MGFLGTLLAIVLWRLWSKLKPVDYDKIRKIIKEEIKINNTLPKVSESKSINKKTTGDKK